MKLVGRPEEMNVGQLVRQVAPDFTIAECFDPNRRHDCVIASSCRLQLMLDKAVHAFLEVLDNNTLADLLQNPTRLNSLLKIETVESKPG